MLGLRQHVSRNPLSVSLCCDDDDFGRACDEVNASVARDELLCGGDIDVPGPDYTIDARNGLRSKSHRRDGLRPTHLEEVCDAEPSRKAEDLSAGARARDAGGFDASDLRGN